MKVAFFSTKSYDKEYFNKFNHENFHELTFFEVPLNHQTASLTAGFEAVCVFVNDEIDEKTIEIISANGIKVVALRCAGFNNIDLKSAKSKNLKVLRVPAYSPESVAEHATALILTLNRKTHKAYNRVREGNFSIENLTGFNLSGKTVGVIGTGLIGASFCKIMLGFGCKVLAYDIQESVDLKEKGVQYKKLEEVLIQSNIISLHCPLTPETAHIVNAGSISKMKDGVMLINTSRGALINAQDAIDGLKTGQIGYMGIDVYEQEADLFFQDLSESVIQDDVIARLISFPNVLITGHLGFFTKEALEEIATITLSNLSDFENVLMLKNEIKS
ncbi:2-hydroxyacid dehydrogenase [Dyadobacter sp. 3J3]|uniref:2-hydroxyacid dehydrogenase n=1 Tax=Dyadobacter sp. 3J3 TaxID=2606600 RepID=UPI001356C3C7|nr:2-hydroxyacid dehydrogenase [Dyadobacter sp. 3J3]